MKILLSWLQEFVTVPGDVRQLAYDLTMLGLTVDTVSIEDGDTVLELDITTNRPDCLSHYGVARELAALYGGPLAAMANSPARESRSRSKDGVVEIVATEMCYRYSARLIKNVKVGPSPEWLARPLENVGVRSINNVADATNYILMAYGHPLHAFDHDLLEGRRIVVRRAADGEPLKTLDGVERRLTAEDLVIADARRPVALAGIMGGEDSEISDKTANVLLESAWFEPVAVRRTAKRQGMHTEASHRFERGADIGATLAAAGRCAELIQQLAGGELDPREIDAYPRKPSPNVITLRSAELDRHLGLEPPPDKVQEILSRLGFSPKSATKVRWKCTVPTHRVDVTREIDLVEEVARHYGYNKFPSRLPGMAEGRPARKTPHAAKESKVRELCLALGYDETISNVLVSRAEESFGEGPAVVLSNPLSEEAAVLRTSMVPGLLAAVQWNLNRAADTVHLFEIGKVYSRDAERFDEPARLAMVATGERIEVGWDQPPKPFDFFDLKGDLEQLAGLFEVACEWDSSGLPAYYRPGHCARISAGGKTIARLGEVNPAEAAKWKFRRPVFIAEVYLDALYAYDLKFRRVKAISRYPAVQRDFSILLPQEKHFSEVRDAIGSLGLPQIVAVEPVEIFRGAPGAPVAPGRYSLLLRVTLRSHESTLGETELADYSSRIMQCLQGLGAQIRM